MEKIKSPGFHKTLRFKIVLVISVTFIMVSLLGGLLIYRELARLITKQDNQRLLSRAASLVDKIEISPLIIPLPEEAEQVRFRYYGKEFNTILFQSPQFDSQRLPAPGTVNDGGANRVVCFRENTENSTTEWIEVILITPNTLGPALRNIKLNITLTIFISVLVSALIAYAVSGYLLRPIQKIITKTDSIDLSKKPELMAISKTGDELHQLSETINRLLIRINETLTTQNAFFAAAAHELRTPLAIMQTELEVTGMDSRLDAATRELVQSQLVEVRRLKRLVEDFLTMSQSRQGAARLNMTQLNIHALLAEAIEHMDGLAQQHQTPFVLKKMHEEETIYVSGDHDKMMSVLLNLIGNALKYNAGRSPVILQVRKQPGSAAVDVINRTIQLPEKMDKLKDDFYQGDLLNEGFGLGLWISNQLLELQKGKLELTLNGDYFKATVQLKM